MSKHFTRRHLLATAGTGFGMLALNDLFARADESRPGLQPHHVPKAKRCIFLFMPGGPSQIDLFDPKPMVLAQNGQPLPFEKPKLERTKTGNLFGSPWKFAKHGECGTDVSELLPHTARHVDDLCVIRLGLNHERPHLPLRRPRLSSDRRAWACREGDTGNLDSTPADSLGSRWSSHDGA